MSTLSPLEAVQKQNPIQNRSFQTSII